MGGGGGGDKLVVCPPAPSTSPPQPFRRKADDALTTLRPARHNGAVVNCEITFSVHRRRTASSSPFFRYLLSTLPHEHDGNTESGREGTSSCGATLRDRCRGEVFSRMKTPQSSNMSVRKKKRRKKETERMC